MGNERRMTGCSRRGESDGAEVAICRNWCWAEKRMLAIGSTNASYNMSE